MKTKLLTTILLIITSIANAREVRVDITDWIISYPPGNEVSILIPDSILNINMVFWRGRLPEDRIVYSSRNNSLKVYYSIDDYSNVLEMLNTITRLSFMYTSDVGFGESAYLAKF